jgi:hypothetical protein
LEGLSTGFQQTIADKLLEEESHQQYRKLVGGNRSGKTTDCRKLTEATVVTTETVLALREQREKLDQAKAVRQANKLAKALNSTGTDKSVPIVRKHHRGQTKKAKIAKKVTVHGWSSTGELCNWEEPAAEWGEGEESDGSQHSTTSVDPELGQLGLDDGDSAFVGPRITSRGGSDVDSGLRRSGRSPKPLKRVIR